MIHDSNGVPTYADANDAKEKLSPRIRKSARFAFWRLCLTGNKEIQLLT